MSQQRFDFRRHRAAVVIGVIVALLIGVNLLAKGLDRAVGGSEPSGVDDSSYATTGNGLAAYATLLNHYGYAVRQQRGDITPESLELTQTFIVVSPTTLTNDEESLLLEFVANGGRLVLAGRSPFYLHKFRDDPPVWSATGPTRWAEIDPALASGTIETAGAGSWTDPGSSIVLVGSNEQSLLTRNQIGRGSVYFLADPSPLENDYLTRADNAAFALALAGPPAQTVTFAEGVHGFGASRGWRAIPSRWKWALALLGLAVLVFAWSRARRFGPPDCRSRALPPARSQYVEALSITLERTRDRAGSLEPVQRWTRDRIAARATLAANPSDEDVARAAHQLGCTEDEIRALFAPVGNDQAVLALGRALARVAGDDRRGT